MSGMQLFLSSALDWTCEGFHPSKSTSLGFTSHCFIPEDPSPGCATGWVRQANKKLSDGYNSMLTGATSTSRARSSFLHTSIGPAAEQQCATTTASFFASGSKQRLPKRLCTVQSSILPDANAAEKTCFFGADTTRDEQVDKDVRMLARSAKRGGRRTGAAKKRWTSFPGEQGNAGGEDEADEEGEDGENGEEADEEDGAGDGEKEDDGKKEALLEDIKEAGEEAAEEDAQDAEEAASGTEESKNAALPATSTRRERITELKNETTLNEEGAGRTVRNDDVYPPLKRSVTFKDKANEPRLLEPILPECSRHVKDCPRAEQDIEDEDIPPDAGSEPNAMPDLAAEE